MSTQVPHSNEKLQPTVTNDLEANQGLVDGHGGLGGAALGRQISVQLTPEQFERLYLQPGGAQAKGDLAKVRLRPFRREKPHTDLASFRPSLAPTVHSASVTPPLSVSPLSCSASPRSPGALSLFHIVVVFLDLRPFVEHF
jgi:hypothetical protein